MRSIVIRVSVCLSVCLFCLSYPKNTFLNFTKFFVHITCGRGSVFLWRHYLLPVLLMTSCFHVRKLMGLIQRRRMFRPVRQVAASGRNLSSLTVSCFEWLQRNCNCQCDTCATTCIGIRWLVHKRSSAGVKFRLQRCQHFALPVSDRLHCWPRTIPSRAAASTVNFRLVTWSITATCTPCICASVIISSSRCSVRLNVRRDRQTPSRTKTRTIKNEIWRQQCYAMDPSPTSRRQSKMFSVV